MSTTTITTVTTTAPSVARVLAVPEAITAENVTTLFPEVQRSLLSADLPANFTSADAVSSSDLTGYDEEQIRLMDEQCIVLTTDDEIIGAASKKYTHLMTNISRGLLHRAFSAFLFHPQTKKLLLQQRASEKITFPDMWTNTCCSHPLAHPSETGTSSDLPSNVAGAKRAATRKLNHELGIPPSQVPAENFTFLTRIHYLAPSGVDGVWGEHEIDYILIIEADPTLDINTNEVRDSRWVSQQELKQMFRDVETGSGPDRDVKYTPWFRLICESMLFQWWDALEKGTLADFQDEKEIRRM